jgi:acyl carrier protein
MNADMNMMAPSGDNRLTTENRAQIKEMVCDILEIEPDELTLTSLFKEDHDADSLRAIEILAALEKKFGLVIDQADLELMVNLDGVYAVVEEAAGKAMSLCVPPRTIGSSSRAWARSQVSGSA